VLKNLSILLCFPYSIALTFFSLTKVDALLEKLPSVSDKIMHAGAHFIFVMLWFAFLHYKQNVKYPKALGITTLLSLLYGILIEVLQAHLTLNRFGDVADVCANGIGMVLAALSIIVYKTHVKL